MKHYFKYRDGYINVNETDLYLTTTGNWSETHKLVEKSHLSEMNNSNRVTYKYFSWIVIYVVILYLLYKFTGGEQLIIAAIIAAAHFFLIVQRFRRDFGLRYRIPLSKITAIEIQNDLDITIHFTNLESKPDFQELKEVQDKGVIFLSKWKTANLQ